MEAFQSLDDNESLPDESLGNKLQFATELIPRSGLSSLFGCWSLWVCSYTKQDKTFFLIRTGKNNFPVMIELI